MRLLTHGKETSRVHFAATDNDGDKVGREGALEVGVVERFVAHSAQEDPNDPGRLPVRIVPDGETSEPFEGGLPLRPTDGLVPQVAVLCEALDCFSERRPGDGRLGAWRVLRGTSREAR